MTLERFDRLLAIRGDTVKGLPTTAWATNLDGYDRDLLMRAVIEATRSLILPEWESKRPTDRRPQSALEAAEAWIKTKSEDAKGVAKDAAKACTEAKNETFGYDHRIAEAARACAWACGAKDNADLWDGIVAIEQELLARIALVSEYQRLPEVRKSLVGTLRRVLEPPPVTEAPVVTGTVAYSASGSFVVGQHLAHVKFGELVVTAVNGAAIDVTLPDGTTKRLAHKPK